MLEPGKVIISFAELLDVAEVHIVAMQIEVAAMTLLCGESFIRLHNHVIERLVEESLRIGVFLRRGYRSLVIPGVELLHAVEFPVEIIPRSL